MTAQLWTLIGVVAGALLATLGQLVTAAVQARHERLRRLYEKRLDLYAQCYRALQAYFDEARRYVRHPSTQVHEDVLAAYREIRHLEVDLALVGDGYVSRRLTRYMNSTVSLYAGNAKEWDLDARTAYSEHLDGLTESLREYMRVMRVDLGTEPLTRLVFLPSLNRKFTAGRFPIPEEPAIGD